MYILGVRVKLKSCLPTTYDLYFISRHTIDLNCKMPPPLTQFSYCSTGKTFHGHESLTCFHEENSVVSLPGLN